MTIQVSESLLHWNYFIALEDDLSEVSRYIEFSEKNFHTYSIELAHLLLASASEVDVVSKEICQLLDPDSNPSNIDGYKSIITNGVPNFSDELVLIPRFGLTLQPWINWGGKQNPFWWQKYNKVKHQRSDHFEDANLNNALNSMAGLFVSVFHFYRLTQGFDATEQGYKDTTRQLKPDSQLLRLEEKFYYGRLLLE